LPASARSRSFFRHASTGRRHAPRAQRGRDRHRQADVHQLPRRVNPAENLVGIATASSQGALRARQLRADRVGRSHLPGVVITAQRRGQGERYPSTGSEAPTSRRRSPACRSTCRLTGTATAIPI
jgi:hypothetical protein